MAAPDFTAINAAALAHCPGLLESWLPGGRLVGREYTCGSLAGGPGDSCKVNVDSGRWADFANQGHEGGDLVSLFASLNGLEQGEAARELARQFGLGNGNGPQHRASKPRATDWTPIAPAPADAPEPIFQHHAHSTPAKVWTYKDAAGRTLMHVARFDRPNGKEILPMTFCRDASGRMAWRWQSMPTPRPLYGLDHLAARPDAPVLVVEGEKAADAAQQLCPWAVAITWPGGSQAVKKADWRTLAGRRVAIWPDADEPGFKAAQAIATSLGGIASEVSVIRPPEGVAQGWDLADAETEGWPPERVKAWIGEHRGEQEGPARPRGLSFIGLKDLLAKPRPTDWLIQDYLEAQSLSVLFGASGSMKSFVAIDMALCIASATPWHGKTVGRAAPVFYIAGEGFRGLAKRMKAWLVAHNPAAAPALFVSDRPAQFLDAESAAEVHSAVNALVEAHGKPRLVIVDTLARCFGPGDENDTQAMVAFVQAMDALKAAFGCAVLVVHHSGLQEQGRSRGSSALRAALDFEFRLDVDSDVRTLVCTKSKDHDQPESITFEPRQVETGWTDPATGNLITSVVLERSAQGAVKRAKPLNGANRIAFNALATLCKDESQEDAPSIVCPLGMPTDLHAVHVEDWRAAAYSAGISASDQHAKKVAFQRAVRSLLDTGHVLTEADFYWPSEYGTIRHKSAHVPPRNGTTRHTPPKGGADVPGCGSVGGENFISGEGVAV